MRLKMPERPERGEPVTEDAVIALRLWYMGQRQGKKHQKTMMAGKFYTMLLGGTLSTAANAVQCVGNIVASVLLSHVMGIRGIGLASLSSQASDTGVVPHPESPERREVCPYKCLQTVFFRSSFFTRCSS